ncbi:MAG: hypothetical protein AVDCRST_MAG20-2883, partial [uncultured Acidimicrobiales bacterium]
MIVQRPVVNCRGPPEGAGPPPSQEAHMTATTDLSSAIDLLRRRTTGQV